MNTLLKALQKLNEDSSSKYPDKIETKGTSFYTLNYDVTGWMSKRYQIIWRVNKKATLSSKYPVAAGSGQVGYLNFSPQCLFLTQEDAMRFGVQYFSDPSKLFVSKSTLRASNYAVRIDNGSAIPSYASETFVKAYVKELPEYVLNRLDDAEFSEKALQGKSDAEKISEAKEIIAQELRRILRPNFDNCSVIFKPITDQRDLGNTKKYEGIIRVKQQNFEIQTNIYIDIKLDDTDILINRSSVGYWLNISDPKTVAFKKHLADKSFEKIIEKLFIANINDIIKRKSDYDYDIVLESPNYFYLIPSLKITNSSTKSIQVYLSYDNVEQLDYLTTDDITVYTFIGILLYKLFFDVLFDKEIRLENISIDIEKFKDKLIEAFKDIEQNIDISFIKNCCVAAAKETYKQLTDKQKIDFEL